MVMEKVMVRVRAMGCPPPHKKKMVKGNSLLEVGINVSKQEKVEEELDFTRAPH